MQIKIYHSSISFLRERAIGVNFNFLARRGRESPLQITERSILNLCFPMAPAGADRQRGAALPAMEPRPPLAHGRRLRRQRAGSAGLSQPSLPVPAWLPCATLPCLCLALSRLCPGCATLPGLCQPSFAVPPFPGCATLAGLCHPSQAVPS